MPHAIRTAPSASNVRTLNVVDFRGGLNLRDEEFRLSQNETPDCLNVDFDQRGGFALRGGVTEFVAGTEVHDDHPSVHTVDGFYGGWEFRGDQSLILNTPTSTSATYPTELWEVDTAGAMTRLTVSSNDCGEGFVCDAAEYAGTAATAEEPRLYVTFGEFDQSNAFLADPAPTVRIDLTGVASKLTVVGEQTTTTDNWANDYSSPGTSLFPSARYCDVHQDYMFVGYVFETVGFDSFGSRTVRKENRIRWSHPGDPESWAENDYIDIDPGKEGDQITGIVSFNDTLIVFKHRSMYALTGYDRQTFSIVNISESVGCSGPAAFVKTPEGLFFYDERTGVWQFDGRNLKYLFSNLFPLVGTDSTGVTIKPVTGEEDSTYGAAHWPSNCVHVGYHDRRVWLSVRETAYATGTVSTHFPTDTTYVYAIDSGAWTKYDFGCAGFIETDLIEGEQTLYARVDAGYNTAQTSYALVRLHQEGQPYDEFWQNLASAADSGNNVYSNTNTQQIDAYFVTPWFTMGEPDVKKRWKRPTYIMQGDDAATVNVDVFHDFDAATVQRTHTAAVEQVGSGDSSDYVRGSSLGTKRAVRLKFKSPTAAGTYTDEPHWGVDGIVFKYVPKAVR